MRKITVPILCCKALSKSFHRKVIPTTLLQDQLLQRHRHKEAWHVHAVKSVTFDIQEGEWLGIYGPNGCGKTTLLRLIAGVLKPEAGTVEKRGKTVCFFGLGRGMNNEMTILENLYIYGLLHGINLRKHPDRLQDILNFADVDSHLYLPLKCLSTGMRMRLCYAAALHMEADIYLFDEIFAVGDRAFRKRCIEAMRQLRIQGKTVVLVGHSLEILTRHCDRILYMEEGCIVCTEDVAGKQPLPAIEKFASRKDVLMPFLYKQTGAFLDLGCGSGDWATKAASCGWDATAVDVRPQRMLNTDGVEWVVSDVRQYAIQPGQFDLIFCLGLLYHLDLADQLALLRKCSHTHTIIDTHIGAPQEETEEGYKGTFYREFPSAYTAQEQRSVLNSAWGNTFSFWPSETALQQMIHDCGFSSLKRLKQRSTNRVVYEALP